MANQLVIPTRTIWCDSCQKPEPHWINYSGTIMHGKTVFVVFYSTCQRCFDEYQHRLKHHIYAVRHEVSATDYNALLKREIYP